MNIIEYFSFVLSRQGKFYRNKNIFGKYKPNLINSIIKIIKINILFYNFNFSCIYFILPFE